MTSALAQDNKAEPADYDGRYAVTSALEIGQILQNLERRAVLITADLAGGGFFLTSVVATDVAGGYMWLDTAQNPGEIDRVLRASRMACSCNLEKVQVQFSCSGMEADEHDGRPAFRVPLPQSVTRLQRREHFRIETLVVSPLKCVVTQVRDGKPVRIELVAADISCGGLGLIIPPGQFTPEPGAAYACTIGLPGGKVDTAIAVHHTRIMKGAHGKESMRSGFSFVNPPGTMMSAIQRYIMQLERERRAKNI